MKTPNIELMEEDIDNLVLALSKIQKSSNKNIIDSICKNLIDIKSYVQWSDSLIDGLKKGVNYDIKKT